MAVSDKLLAIAQKISAQITKANTKTGESDATLTDAVQTLCDGYGGGLMFDCSSGGITPLRSVIGETCSLVAPEMNCYYGGIADVT